MKPPPTVEYNKCEAPNKGFGYMLVAAIIFVFVVVSLTSIIEERNVTPAHYNQAVQLCEPNKGLKHFNVFNNDEWIKVTCNNGAVFTGIRIGGENQ